MREADIEIGGKLDLEIPERRRPSLSSQPAAVQCARRASNRPRRRNSRSSSRIVTPYMSFVPGCSSSTR